MTRVIVRQITQKNGDGAYMNVDEDEFSVSVWTFMHGLPTYLMQNGLEVRLIQFEDQEVADEWLEQNKSLFPKIAKLKETKTKIINDDPPLGWTP